jgi:hypothetical protein
MALTNKEGETLTVNILFLLCIIGILYIAVMVRFQSVHQILYSIHYFCIQLKGYHFVQSSDQKKKKGDRSGRISTKDNRTKHSTNSTIKQRNR